MIVRLNNSLGTTTNNMVTLPYRIKSDSEYIPVYMIPGSDLSFLAKGLLSTYQKIIFDDTFSTRHEKLMEFIRSHSYYNPPNKSSFVEDVYESVNPLIKEFYYTNYPRRSSYASLSSEGRTGVSIIGRNHTINYRHSLFMTDPYDRIVIPMYVFAVRRDLIRYIKQCSILKRDIHPDAVKLFVNNKLDITRSPYGSLRPRYRKYVKKPMLDAGIEIEEVETFDMLYKRLELPKAATIEEYEEMFDTLGLKCIDAEKELNKEIQLSNIKLKY